MNVKQDSYKLPSYVILIVTETYAYTCRLHFPLRFQVCMRCPTNTNSGHHARIKTNCSISKYSLPAISFICKILQCSSEHQIISYHSQFHDINRFWSKHQSLLRSSACIECRLHCIYWSFFVLMVNSHENKILSPLAFLGQYTFQHLFVKRGWPIATPHNNKNFE